LSFVLIGAGMVLLFLGGRDWLDSHLGQNKAQSEFDETVSARLSPFGSGSAAEPRIAPGDAVAKLTIPRLHTELYVVEGDGASELRRGPGHVTGTVMPGQPGNCIIAGHRDTHFRVLKDIRSGDQIVLQTKSGEYRYQVSGTHVVSPSNTASLKPTQDAELHLITCYPFYYLGSAPRRFIVQAQLLAPVIGR
jgi:sortase A